MAQDRSLRRRKDFLFQNHTINKENIKRDIIVIGASAGGVLVLKQLFAILPKNLSASVFVVIHRGSAPGELAAVLGRRSILPVVEAENGMEIARNIIYLGAADHHLLVQNGRLAVDRGPKEHGTRPAVDPLFRTAAAQFGSRIAGLILTGCGDDGVAGMIAVKEHGGLCLAQDPEESYMPSMPLNAIRYDDVDQILSVVDIGPVLAALANGEEVKAGRPMPNPRRKLAS